MIKKVRRYLAKIYPVVYDRVRGMFDESILGLISVIILIGLIINVVVFLATLVPFIAGWATLTVVGLFITVGTAGYWSTVVIGIAVFVIGSILS